MSQFLLLAHVDQLRRSSTCRLSGLDRKWRAARSTLVDPLRPLPRYPTARRSTIDLSGRLRRVTTTPAAVASAAIKKNKFGSSILPQSPSNQPAIISPINARAELQPHDQGDRARRRDLRHQRQPSRPHVELTESDEDEKSDQSKRTRLAIVGQPGDDRHHKKRERQTKASNRQLGDARRGRAVLALPSPQPEDRQRKHEGYEPRQCREKDRWNFTGPEQQIDRAVIVVRWYCPAVRR